MRVLVIHPGPEHSVADVFSGWCWGLAKNKVQVRAFALGERLAFYARSPQVDDPDTAVALANESLRAACYDWWPHLVLVVSGFNINETTLEIVRARRHHVVLLCTESPYEEQRQLALAPYCDTVLLNDPTNIAKYRDVCADTMYVPHSWRPGRHFPPPAGAEPECELFFAGTGFPARVLFFREFVDAAADIDLRLAGPWFWLSETGCDKQLQAKFVKDPSSTISNDEVAEWYRKAQTGINVYRQEAETVDQCAGWAMGPREIEMAACGLWFCTEERPENRETLPMLPAFTTVGEAVDQVRWALGHPEERHKAATSARLAVVDWTFDKRAADLLRHVMP